MKKTISILALAAALTACSQEASDKSQPASTLDVAEEVAPAAADSAASGRLAGQPPGISASVAPGVAFDFRYEFSLPEARIAAVQEEHANLCGRLGVSRCRVTGLTFNKDRDGDVQAMMAFKLDPALALGFARDATDLVERAEGKLATSQVSGEDVGTGIVEGDKNAAGIQAELRKAEAELKIPGLSKDARERLVQRQQELRAKLTELTRERGDKVESLATTPVLFNYTPGDTVWGMDRNTPLRQGLSTGGDSFSAMFGFLALVIGAVAPWALLALAVWWVVRRLRSNRVVTDQS